jgi:two-component system LytT family sensor kinase
VCIGEQAELIRDAEIVRLVSQAELRALQSQIHPHFLFNALNTLYGIIPRDASGARRMLLDLADIFRYFLRTERTYIALEEEMRIVKAYLSIEELRLGGKLRTVIEVDPTALCEFVPVLSIQPLVENAVKHGIASRPEGGTVRIEATRYGAGLRISVHDTGSGFAAFRSAGQEPSGEGLAQHTGVGLENISKRLNLCYGALSVLSIENTDKGTIVSFVAPCLRPAEALVK